MVCMGMGDREPSFVCDLGCCRHSSYVTHRLRNLRMYKPVSTLYMCIVVMYKIKVWQGKVRHSGQTAKKKAELP